MNEYLSFGSRLKRLRVGAELTQDALAEQVGCAVQTIRMFESNLRRPSRDLAERLADAVGVVPDDREGFIRQARARREQAPTAPADDPSDVPAEPAEPIVVTRPLPAALPLAPNALIGRQWEHEAIRAALLDPSRRLVTVIGPGGIGKSRLALQLASDLAAHFGNTVVWVSLAALTQPSDVPLALANALGLTIHGNEPIMSQVLEYLWEQPALIVLDNFEHLLGAVEYVSDILVHAPSVHLLVTSRERLRIAGEWAIELTGLALPPDEHDSAITRSAAVLLFVERARQVDRTFALTSLNRTVVAQICKLLDGIPLAIELAAAWIRLLSPNEISEEIQRSLDFLASSERNTLERHASLRAVFDHSLRLLDDEERRTFERLAVFRGTFGRQAAAVIADASLRTLADLVDKSLIVSERGGEHGPRYRLLEPIRQHALERLPAPSLVDLERRHADLYLDVAEQAASELRGPRQPQTLHRLDLDYDNLHAAMDWALRAQAFDIAARFGWALHLFWWIRGYQDEGRRVMEQVLRASGLATRTQAQASCVLGIMLYGSASASAIEYFDRSAALFDGIGDESGRAYALAGSGLMALQIGDGERAQHDLERSFALHTRLDDTWMMTQLSTYLGLLYLHQGRFALAEQYHRDALREAERVQDQWGMCLATYNLATLAHAQGATADARSLFRDAMTLAQSVGNDATIAYCVQALALLAQEAGDAQRAVLLYAGASALLGRIGQPLYAHMPDPARYDERIAALRDELGPTAFGEAWRQGRDLTRDALVAEAMR